MGLSFAIVSNIAVTVRKFIYYLIYINLYTLYTITYILTVHEKHLSNGIEKKDSLLTEELFQYYIVVMNI